MKQAKLKYIWILMSVMSFGALGQPKAASKTVSTTSAPKAAIKMIGRVMEDKILLRWAPDAPIAWRLSNQWGYSLERFTIVRGGKMLAVAEKKILLTSHKPAPLAEWETLVNTDDNAAVIAQALYGQSFVVGSADKSKLAKIVSMSQEQEQRFGIALYAADHNFIAAQKAALGYSDTDVRKGEKYLYRIISLVPSAQMHIDTGAVFMGMDSYEPLPKPRGLVGVYTNKSVMLSWEYQMLRSHYNSYIVERSGGGAAFMPLNKLPVSNLNEKENQNAASIYYADSLPDNGIKYNYRVRGINAFGQSGPPSDSVSGMGIEQLNYVPNISHAELKSAKAVLLEWVFDKAGEPLLKAFGVEVAGQADGTYETVMQGIEPSKRSVIYIPKKPLEGSYYFKITATPKSGESRTGFAVLVQTIDTVPPLPPTILEALIDTGGIVSIRWKANTEKDIFGYRLFRASVEGEEYSPVNSQILTNTRYSDTVQLRSLNQKVYYKLKATDQRFNNSGFSLPFIAIKPDVLAPAAPIFVGYDTDQKGIKLLWQPSISADVVRHTLYRSSSADKTSSLVALKSWPANDTTRSYVDEKAIYGPVYTYSLVAIDKAGLQTTCPQPLSLEPSRALSLIRPAIKSLQVYKNTQPNYIDLLWSYSQKGVAEYLIYRAEGNASPSLWMSLGAGARRIRDPEVRMGKAYSYSIIARFEDGGQSKFITIKTNY